MLLRELVQKHSHKEIFNIIYTNYYHQASSDNIYGAAVGYRNVFNFLLSLPVMEDSFYKIKVRKNPVKETICDEVINQETGIEVCLYCNNDAQTYALDLKPWKELIDLPVLNDLQCDDAALLAYILREITFYGFKSPL